jgi:hypothetical protein
MKTETLTPRWTGKTVIVAAPGPSLSDAAPLCRGHPIVAVQDAHRLIPWADVLYGCESAWWRVHNGCPEFKGEKWSTHDRGGNDKWRAAREFGLRLVEGSAGKGFSPNPALVHYGKNSGFQAVNMALLWGAARIVLVGFDMREVGGKRHFFGDHPRPLRNTSSYASFVAAFVEAVGHQKPTAEIVNATPRSHLMCFPAMSLRDAIASEMAA